jgi:hypothetical protein
MKYEHLVYATIFILLCVIFYNWTKYSIESNTPPFIAIKLSQLKEDKRLMDSIGGFKYFEFSYNKNDFKLSDTVQYSITIKGDKRILNYKATQFKSVGDRWTEFRRELKIENK